MKQDSLTVSTEKCVVLRPFVGGGGARLRGEVVDTKGWRTTASLVNLRYLAPLPHGTKLYTVDMNGEERVFASQEYADQAFESLVGPEPMVETETEKPVLTAPEREAPKGTR